MDRDLLGAAHLDLDRLVRIPVLQSVADEVDERLAEPLSVSAGADLVADPQEEAGERLALARFPWLERLHDLEARQPFAALRLSPSGKSARRYR